MFDLFCVTVIRNFGRSLKRAAENRRKHDGTGEKPVEYLLELLSHEDVYEAEQLLLYVDDIACMVENELFTKHCNPCRITRGGSFFIAIECKDWDRPVNIGKIMDFSAKLDDLNNISGVMVSKSGYQAGTKQYAQMETLGVEAAICYIPFWSDDELEVPFIGIPSDKLKEEYVYL